MNVLGVTALSAEVSAGEVKLWSCDFDHYDLMSYQKFLHAPLSGAPQKCIQSGPTLAKAGPVCDSSLYPKQLSLFCLQRLISTSADRSSYITNFCSVIEL